MDEITSVDDPGILELTGLLTPYLRSVGDASTAIEIVAAALDSLYPDRVEETFSIPSYKLVWCEEIQQTKVVCCSVTSFVVDARGSSITVVVEETTVLGKG